MMPDQTPPKNRKRNGAQAVLKNIHALQDRIVEESAKAKGQALSALCRAYDLLEERKRVLRGRPHPDVLSRGYSYRGGNRLRTLARESKAEPPGQPFPEPTEPGTQPGNGTGNLSGTLPGEAGEETPGEETGEGISFGGPR